MDRVEAARDAQQRAQARFEEAHEQFKALVRVRRVAGVKGTKPLLLQSPGASAEADEEVERDAQGPVRQDHVE